MKLLDYLDKRHSVAGPGYNRWLVPPAALAIHLAVGQAYAFSVFNIPLGKQLNAPFGPAAAASLAAMGWIFSIAIVFLGLSAALFGKWLEAAGPRKAMFASACCFGGGFLVSAFSIRLHLYWGVMLGYGVLGGIGLGLGYISPVSTLIRWFPDRPGMATGMAIMGFGGGAMIGAPLAVALMKLFSNQPTHGVAQTFAVMGVIYTLFMMFGVLTVRLPGTDYNPAIGQALPQLSADEAIRTLPFWQLWAVLFVNVTAGIAVLSQASPMIQEMFPGRVSGAQAAGFVGLLSLFNLAGRFAWSTVSDTIGRKATYAIFFVLGIALYAAIPSAGKAGSMLLFVGSFAVILSMYGGGFATIPAYLRDLFGTSQVGAIHGRLLTAWSAAGIAGPLLISSLRQYQRDHAIQASQAYSSTMYLLAALLGIGLICNWLVRPVSTASGPAATDVPHEPATTEDRGVPAISGAVWARLAPNWLFVGAPLLWGVWQTLQKAFSLFR